MRDRLLTGLADLAVRRSRGVVVAALLLTLAGAVLAATRLRIDSDQDHLISAGLEWQKRYLDYLDDFGDREHFYVAIEGPPERARAFADALGAELRQQPDLFPFVHVRLETSDFGDNLLLLAPQTEVDALASMIGVAGGDLRGFASDTTLAAVIERLAIRFETADAASAEAWGPVGDRFLATLIGEVEAGARGDPPAGASAAVDRLFPPFELPVGQAYLRHGSLLLVEVAPTKDYRELNPVAAPLREARAAVARVAERFPDVQAGVTGRAALSADEMERTSSDMTWAGLLSALLVTIVFMLGFRGLLRPFLTVACLGCAIAWAAGFAVLTVGSLNLLSSVFAIVLLGLGVDFGIHVLAVYQAERTAGGDVSTSARAAVMRAGRGNLTAALTTAGAFFCTLLTDFSGLAQLGLIAGVGVLLCCLAMLLVLPAALVWLDGRGDAPRAFKPLPTFAALERAADRPRRGLAVGLLLCAGLGVFADRVVFDQDLLGLQSPREESVIWERRLLEQPGFSTWVTASLVKSPAALAKREAALRALPEVARVEGPSAFVGPAASQRRDRLRWLGRTLGALSCPGGSATAERAPLEGALERLIEALEVRAEQALRAGVEGASAAEGLVAYQERLEAVLAKLSVGPAFGARQEAFVSGLHARLKRLEQLLRPSGWTRKTLPPWIQRTFVGKSGQLALFVFPKEDVWDPATMSRFLAAVRAVDPDVTGATVSVHESSAVMRDAFRTTLLATGVLVLLLLLVDFRTPLGLLAVIPLGVGGVWLLGAMGLVGLNITMANFFVLPVLIGVGIDDGVHMLHRWRDAPDAPLAGHATGTGVILSSLTTMAGFGALGITEHPGLASIGGIMVLGAGCLLIAAVIVMPAILRTIRSRADAGRPRP